MTFLGPTKSSPKAIGPLTIRRALLADRDALERLAAADSSRMPAGTVLLAEVGDELWAAASADDFHAVADPFRPSSELVFLLVEHARQLRRAERRPRGGWRSRLRAPRPAFG